MAMLAFNDKKPIGSTTATAIANGPGTGATPIATPRPNNTALVPEVPPQQSASRSPVIEAPTEAPTLLADQATASAVPPAAPALSIPVPVGPGAEAAAPPASAATGGAAILARLRQQRGVNATADNLITGTSSVKAPPPPVKPLVAVLYGSQTGTAEEIARTLAADALTKGYSAVASSLSAFGFEKISASRTPIVIVISSSTGDGEPPENAISFMASLRRKPPPGTPPPSLAGVRFTALGLGDSNYTRFMAVPRSIRSRFAELGAAEFYPSVEADEVDGIENKVEPWTEGLWDKLAEVVELAAKEAAERSWVPKGPTAEEVTAAAAAAEAAKKAEEAKKVKEEPDAAAAPAPSAEPHVAVLYGSQTGTAEEIARNIAAEAMSRGFNATCSSLRAYGFANVTPSRSPLVIMVASSTGDGDPPDNATIFMNSLRRKPPPGTPPPSLAGVRFTVLGLGDSNYTRFMAVPRSIRSRFTELGAAEFYPSVEADEVDGIENKVEPWTEGLWAKLGEAVAHIKVNGIPSAMDDGVKAAADAEATKQAAEKAAKAAAEKAAAEAAAKAAAERLAAEVAAKDAAARAAAEAEAKEAAEKVAAEAALKAAAEKAAAEAAAKEAADRAAAEAATKEAEEKAAAEAAAKEAADRAAAEAAAQEVAEATPVETGAETPEDQPVAEVAGNEDVSNAAQAPSLPEPETPVAEPSAPQAEDAASLTPEAAADPEASAAPAAEATEAATQEASAPAAAPADADTERPSSAASDCAGGSLLPDALLSVLEAGAAPGSTTAGLPTIAESRVFEDEVPAAPTAAANGTPLETPRNQLLTPRDEADRPDSRLSATSGSTMQGTSRRSVEITKQDREAAEAARKKRLAAKPVTVNFPKRDETVVKRKDEKEYGLLMGLAPVGCDTKGAPSLLPCRLRIVWEKDEAKARQVVSKEAAAPTRDERHYVDPAGMYSAAQPFWAHVTDARYETATWSERKVLHLELSIRNSNMAYEPGDSIGVLPSNPPDLVLNLCKRLGLNPDRVLNIVPAAGAAGAAANGADGAEGADAAQGRPAAHIPSPCSVFHALSRCVDLTSCARKSTLRLLAEHCRDAAEKRTLLYLSGRAGKAAYAHEIAEHQPSLLDLLVRFPSCAPPLDALLDGLPPLAPRLYSISSSRRDPGCRGGNRLSVALSVVRFKTRYGTRLGVASTWLDRLAAPFTTDGMELPTEPTYLPVFLRRAADFKPPPVPATPLVMVGPGTGVAPFRGFLQDRRAALREVPPEERGAAVLFFGCRREDEDYLYREDLEAFQKDGTLATLHLAFSRAQADKVYVQDLLKQQGAAVWALMAAGAHVYVCGDGASMAKDVHAALCGLVAEHGGMEAEAAAAYMQNLVQERRYIRDVWS